MKLGKEFVVYEKMIFVAVSKTSRVEFCLYWKQMVHT
jgi:hypothetical protein